MASSPWIGHGKSASFKTPHFRHWSKCSLLRWRLHGFFVECLEGRWWLMLIPRFLPLMQSIVEHLQSEQQCVVRTATTVDSSAGSKRNASVQWYLDSFLCFSLPASCLACELLLLQEIDIWLCPRTTDSLHCSFTAEKTQKCSFIKVSTGTTSHVWALKLVAN